mmetsp:Transcript_501/g.1422  ORF Transcript_501/g.1422 Transcript_501/m.1422 type:complete len:353 (+) Transcript_501:511-1569(+)
MDLDCEGWECGINDRSGLVALQRLEKELRLGSVRHHPHNVHVLHAVRGLGAAVAVDVLEQRDDWSYTDAATDEHQHAVAAVVEVEVAVWAVGPHKSLAAVGFALLGQRHDATGVVAQRPDVHLDKVVARAGGDREGVPFGQAELGKVHKHVLAHSVLPHEPGERVFGPPHLGCAVASAPAHEGAVRQQRPQEPQHLVDCVNGNGSDEKGLSLPNVEEGKAKEAEEEVVGPEEDVEQFSADVVGSGRRDAESAPQRCGTCPVDVLAWRLEQLVEVERTMEKRQSDGDPAEKAMVQDDVVECHPEEPRQNVVSGRRNHEEHRVGCSQRANTAAEGVRGCQKERHHVEGKVEEDE